MVMDAYVSKDQKAFSEALEKCSEEQLKAPYNRFGQTLLHILARDPDSFYTKTVITKGIIPNQPDFKGYLPLHYAAMSGHEEQVKLLLGAYPEAIHVKSKNGANAAVVAVQH